MIAHECMDLAAKFELALSDVVVNQIVDLTGVFFGLRRSLHNVRLQTALARQKLHHTIRTLLQTRPALVVQTIFRGETEENLWKVLSLLGEVTIVREQ